MMPKRKRKDSLTRLQLPVHSKILIPDTEKDTESKENGKKKGRRNVNARIKTKERLLKVTYR